MIIITESKESIEDLVRGLNPDDPSTIALKQAAIDRPIPAIEKPIGHPIPSVEEAEVVLINNLPEQIALEVAWSEWNDVARQHPWG